MPDGHVLHAGVIVGGAVPPLACLLTWRRCTSSAAVSGTFIAWIFFLITSHGTACTQCALHDIV